MGLPAYRPVSAARKEFTVKKMAFLVGLLAVAAAVLLSQPEAVAADLAVSPSSSAKSVRVTDDLFWPTLLT